MRLWLGSPLLRLDVSSSLLFPADSARVPNAIIGGSEIRVNALAKSIDRDTRVSPDLESSRVMSSTIGNHVGERAVSFFYDKLREEEREIITDKEREKERRAVSERIQITR